MGDSEPHKPRTREFTFGPFARGWIFWSLGLGVLLPVFWFMYSHVLLFFLLLITLVFGDFSAAWLVHTINIISGLGALASIITLWRTYRKRDSKDGTTETEVGNPG